MKEKTALMRQFVCFQMPPEKDFRPEDFFKFKYFSEKLRSSKITLLHQEGTVLTMFLIKNSSPLLVINSVFMPIYIWSNLQKCPVPLRLLLLGQTFCK